MRLANPDNPFPLASHGEDRVHGGIDAKPGFAEIILEAFENEGRIECVRANNRCFEGQSGSASHGDGFLLAGIVNGHVNPRRPLKKLDGGRNFMDHEIIVTQQSLRDRFRRKQKQNPIRCF